MVDYTRGTGTSGTLIIRDSGTRVAFLIRNTSSPTFIGSASWHGRINGVNVGGTYSINGAQTVQVDSRPVSSSQTVSFGIAATGTEGLGGPTSFSQSISRSSVPGAPGRPSVSNIKQTVANLSWSAAATNGSSIVNYGVQVSSNSSFTNLYFATDNGTSRSVRATGLRPAGRFYARVAARNGVGRGPWSATRMFIMDPEPPSSTTFTGAGVTWLSISWGRADNGSTLKDYQIQYSRNSDFSGAATRTTTATSATLTGLEPGTRYYVRVRARNTGNTFGGYNASRSGSTLPVEAPGMTVTPSIAGTSATVALTPPSGAAVTRYRVEQRPLGGTATSVDKTTSPVVFNNLTPGRSYQYRSSAFVGVYQTPWTDWVTRIQPNPNINPGDYFDGSTEAQLDVAYRWTGTTNLSTSEAVGVTVAGWTATTDSGEPPRLQRISGGWSGEFAARAINLTDREDGSYIYLGMNFEDTSHHAEIGEGGAYSGSVYVRPSRPQRLVVEIVWIDENGEEMERSAGEGTEVTDTEAWTRLVTSAQAPIGAITAVVLVRDIEGEGYSPWLSGDWLDADAMMFSLSLYPYFDGSTPDTAGFAYSWLGSPHSSASVREGREIEFVDPLADPDCPPLATPPRPPRVDDSCIDVTGSWRRYWAIISETEVFDWLSVVPTLTMTTGEIAARQVRIRFYANPDMLPPEDAGDLPIESEQVVSYLPPNTQLTIDGVSRRVWASVDGGEDLAAGHLLYGVNGGPATWPTLECGSAYLVSFDVPLDAPAGNLEVGVELTTRMM